MKSLAALSKYLGVYDRWQQIKQRYSLHWTSGNESLEAMERFFNPALSLDSMLSRIKDMIRLLPPFMAQIIKFNVITGLRTSEITESVRLINDKEAFTIKYYDPNTMTLSHYKFSQFIRTTKPGYHF